MAHCEAIAPEFDVAIHESFDATMRAPCGTEGGLPKNPQARTRESIGLAKNL
jgi:hypothetical protein